MSVVRLGWTAKVTRRHRTLEGMALKTGQLPITGAAQQLTSTQYEVDQLTIRAPSANAAAVYFGAAGVTTSTGHPLEPGEEFTIRNELRSGGVTYDLDPHELFVVGTAGSDRITWLAWTR